jgi:hypothetical protein
MLGDRKHFGVPPEEERDVDGIHRFVSDAHVA